MIPDFLARLTSVALAFACFGASAPKAAEQEPPAPWVKLSGRNAGAVGTCSRDEISEITDCYLVRCDPKEGLTFAIQSPNLADFDIRSLRFEIGGFRKTFKVKPSRDGEQTISLEKEAAFLRALKSGASWATMYAGPSSTGYSTGFDLQGAGAIIPTVAKACTK